jgi:radical SAM protein with 4Fe4S-binding SPASM domain
MKLEFSNPTNCVWEITQICNMRCLHCGSYATGKRKNELTTEEALDLCDQLGEIGLTYITISGGEPLLRPDWPLIAKRLLENRVNVSMITNGYFIKENLEKLLPLKNYLSHIAVSIDGLRETHDYIRQTEGAFDRTMEGISLLRKHGFSTGVITTVSRWNLHELEELQLELMRCRVLHWQVQTVFLGGRMREHNSQLPMPEDIIPLAQFIVRESKKFKAKKIPINTFSADSLGYCSSICNNLMPGWKGCQAGLRCLGIESDGTIKGCLSLSPEIKEEKDPFAEASIREKRLKDIWEDKNRFLYNRSFDKRKVRGFCRNCEHLEKCRCGCSQSSYYATGSKYENPYCLYRLEKLGYNINEPYNSEVLKERFKDAIEDAEQKKKEFRDKCKGKRVSK